MHVDDGVNSFRVYRSGTDGNGGVALSLLVNFIVVSCCLGFETEEIWKVL
jgi:hypothetical protein